jgi:hypothetical protein
VTSPAGQKATAHIRKDIKLGATILAHAAAVRNLKAAVYTKKKGA